ncbi:MAG: hypothetical protein KDA61_16885 [Planctomycetales bacterium]|nr:hypothetical protein [Planctomycetales bacterium]
MTAVTGCGRKDGLAVRGVVRIDDRPIHSGTLSFQHVDEPGVSEGTLVENGAFEMAPDQRLPPGRYRVSLEGFCRTGRTVQDPQRGPIDELARIAPHDNQLALEIDASNADRLEISFHEAPQ